MQGYNCGPECVVWKYLNWYSYISWNLSRPPIVKHTIMCHWLYNPISETSNCKKKCILKSVAHGVFVCIRTYLGFLRTLDRFAFMLHHFLLAPRAFPWLSAHCLFQELLTSFSIIMQRNPLPKPLIADHFAQLVLLISSCLST